MLPPRRMPQHRRLLRLYLCPRLPARTPRSLLPRSVPTPGLNRERVGKGRGGVGEERGKGRSLDKLGSEWTGSSQARRGGGACRKGRSLRQVGKALKSRSRRGGEKAVEGRGLECQAEKETGLLLLTLSRRRGRMQRGGPLPERHLYQHRRLFRVHLSSGTPRRPRPRLLSRCEAPPWPDPSLLCLLVYPICLPLCLPSAASSFPLSSVSRLPLLTLLSPP